MTTAFTGLSPTGAPPFGRVLTAMVTPFTATGELDVDRVGELATRLVDAGNDGLVVSGTTGESPTTSHAEKRAILAAVVAAVGERAAVIAGVGTYDTAESVELAQQAQDAGAHGLLVVTPYYSRPQQAGLIAHFTAVADATDLPVLLYDIPPRSVVPIETDTLLRLAAHPRIVGVKDAKGDVAASSEVLARTDLVYYSGDDPMTLPLMAVGAVGVVSVTAHVLAPQIRAMVYAAATGDFSTALRWHRALLPANRAMSRTGKGAGLSFAKAALRLAGFDVGDPRLPQIPASEGQIRLIEADLAEVPVPSTEAQDITSTSGPTTPVSTAGTPDVPVAVGATR
jgi:4-hydroxy-tetrahydrodipicolinate synthase